MRANTRSAWWTAAARAASLPAAGPRPPAGWRVRTILRRPRSGAVVTTSPSWRVRAAVPCCAPGTTCGITAASKRGSPMPAGSTRLQQRLRS
eukprot:scaffold44908_cov66-Phaeocystis_antarctica.AAC.2